MILLNIINNDHILIAKLNFNKQQHESTQKQHPSYEQTAA